MATRSRGPGRVPIGYPAINDRPGLRRLLNNWGTRCEGSVFADTPPGEPEFVSIVVIIGIQ
jgi:hypothetical protein